MRTSLDETIPIEMLQTAEYGVFVTQILLMFVIEHQSFSTSHIMTPRSMVVGSSNPNSS